MTVEQTARPLAFGAADIGFRLFGEPRRITEYLGPLSIEVLRRKFSSTDPRRLELATIELIKYLILAAEAPAIFFPYDTLIDEVWHALLCETAEYRALCNRIKPGTFIDHSGITLRDYAASVGQRGLRDEQISWLVSYVNAFGPITSASLESMNLVKSLLDASGTTLDQLNALCATVASKFRTEPTPETIDAILACARREASRLDWDGAALRSYVSRMAAVAPDLTNDLVFRSYAESGALGFTLHQYVTAYRRLVETDLWRARNPDTYERLVTRSALPGLATTHLAKGPACPVRGRPTEGGHLVSGTAPWVTGVGSFTHVILGFLTTDDGVVQALVPIASDEAQKARGKIFIKRKETMGALDATSTASITFEDLFVPDSSVVSSRKGPLPKATTCRIDFPDLGLAVGALRVAREALPADDDRGRAVLSRLDAEVATFLARFGSDCDPDAYASIAAEKDDLIVRCARFATMATKGSTMIATSAANRIWREVAVIDAVYQPQETRIAKLDLL